MGSALPSHFGLGRRAFSGTLASAGLGLTWGLPRRARAHPQHVSLSQVHFRPQRQVLEWSLRTHVEDLEHVARRASGLPVVYGGKGFGAWVALYLRSVLELSGPKGQPLRPLQWVGSELEAGLAWVYFVVPTVNVQGQVFAPDLQGYQLRQAYLLEATSNQVNTVILHRGTRRDTLHFSPGHSQAQRV